MKYKNYIVRKIGRLVEQRNKSSYTFNGLDRSKEKEIIVYLRLQEGKDKQQMIEFIKDKFNVSDMDAERLFFMAYPDGVDKIEDSLLSTLDETLKGLDCLPKDFIDNTFSSIVENKEMNENNIDPIVVNTVKLVISSILIKRHLI